MGYIPLYKEHKRGNEMAKYAKIQKNIDGKERYSITPQIPGGYITPENLIKIGEVAKKYNASLKVTSAQKICIGNLKEEDIEYFKPLIRNQYFPAVKLFVIRNENGRIAAFMGLSDDMLEMLFVLPEEQGHGYGKAFVDYAIDKCNIYKVDVNEDNEQAYKFYLHMGYEVIGRDELDPSGKPFPILHLQQPSSH